MRPERTTRSQPRSPHPLTWEAGLWGRRVRCHELDRHVYLDGRFLDLTPIEFCLFRLLLQQALQALGSTEPAGNVSPQRYLRQLGIVPTGALLRAMISDPGSLVSLNPSGDQGRSESVTARHLTSPLDSPRSRQSAPPAYRTSSGRACLASHLDRLRGKLRCHGLDVGTVLLFGRSAQGYILLPQDDGFYEEG